MHMAFDGSLARRNDGFETKWFSPGVFSGVRFAHGKLPNGEPQELEPDRPLIGPQGMSYFGFAWLQFQPHVG